MLGRNFVALAVFSLGFALGCNSRAASDLPAASTAAAVADANSPGNTSGPPIPENATPEEVVQRFLAALQLGDDKTAEALLTEKARTETAAQGLAVQPPGSPAAKFRVGAAKFVTESKDAVNVESVWTENNEQGRPQSYQIVWILRQTKAGWRVAGMATEHLPGEVPLVLNFENPAEMISRGEAATAALEHRKGSTTPPQFQANRPSSGGELERIPKR